jgi:hypothetical protein
MFPDNGLVWHFIGTFYGPISPANRACTFFVSRVRMIFPPKSPLGLAGAPVIESVIG